MANEMPLISLDINSIVLYATEVEVIDQIHYTHLQTNNQSDHSQNQAQPGLQLEEQDAPGRAGDDTELVMILG